MDGLDDADPVDVRIRDTFICRPVMAMTKPGKTTTRAIGPESTGAKLFGASVLMSVLMPVKAYFGTPNRLTSSPAHYGAMKRSLHFCMFP